MHTSILYERMDPVLPSKSTKYHLELIYNDVDATSVRELTKNAEYLVWQLFNGSSLWIKLEILITVTWFSRTSWQPLVPSKVQSKTMHSSRIYLKKDCSLAILKAHGGWIYMLNWTGASTSLTSELRLTVKNQLFNCLSSLEWVHTWNKYNA